MSKKTISNPFDLCSSWGRIVLFTLTILLMVVIWNYFTNTIPTSLASIEGFEQSEQIIIKEGPEVYDNFYVNIYDDLVFNQLKNEYEVGEIMKQTKPTSKSKILDIGSGTGHHVALLSANNMNATGVDISKFMVNEAKKNYPDEKFVEGDALNAGLFGPSTFTHITCLYFGIYYFRDKLQFFKNCMKWLMPGGYLVVHLVDRDMFDPILPPSNPLIIVSPQRYANKRITQSKITFNNMDYVANFDLVPNSDQAVFSEKFQHKGDKKVRKNKHIFKMEPEKNIVAMAKQAGFLLQGKIDLLRVGYEYQYLYIFVKPN